MAVGPGFLKAYMFMTFDVYLYLYLYLYLYIYVCIYIYTYVFQDRMHSPIKASWYRS